MKQLERRIQESDPSAYLDLSNEYGWRLYSYLSKRIPNQKRCSEIYEKTLQELYRNISQYADATSVETQLFEIADRLSGIKKSAKPSKSKAPKKTPAAVTAGKEEKEGSGIWFWVCFLLLLLLNLGCLWIIAGLLMDMGVIPMLDLGYSWFHGNVAPLFWK